MIGETVGSYRIKSKLSTGGMGTIYKAEHTLIGKLAAVKVLHPELCNNREIVNRFFNEAKATTQIKHPGIVEVFDFGYMASGHAYLVMEFLQGASMARRLQHKGKVEEGEAAMLMRGVCNALAAAHAKKIVHRDLKPDNLYLCPDPDAPTGERVKILDFGIAKLADASLTGPANVTKTGSVMGTPTYMSPEQCRGTGEVDERADLYSLGCIFYELLAGRPPFTDMGAGELIGAHLFVEPMPPKHFEPAISDEANALVMALIAKDPARRPQTARELGLRFAEVAKSQGWMSHTNPTGRRAPSDYGQEQDEAFDGTLASPPNLKADAAVPSTPPPATPAPATPAPAMPTRQPSLATEPTTLSGAASQSVHDVPRRRMGPWIGLGAALAVVATVVVVGLSRGPKSASPAAARAAEPLTVPAADRAGAAADRAPAPLAGPVPAAASTPAAVPAPVAVPAPAAVPEPAPAAVPAPAAALPPPPVEHTTRPAHVTRPPPTKPPATKPPATKPPAIKPPPTKPPVAKPGTGSGSGKILIETDL